MKCGKSCLNLFGKNFVVWFDGKFGIMSWVISGDLVFFIFVFGSVNVDILLLELKLMFRVFFVIFD